MNTGGPAFPVPDLHHANGQVQYGSDGMTLLDWMAGQEEIGDEDMWCLPIREHYAGPRPTGDWKTNPVEWYEWKARWRARMKYTRASAMLTEKARREAVVKESKTTDHSGEANKMVKQPDACALLRKFISAVPEGFETSLLWDLRKEAIHLLDVVPDHSPDDGKMVELEAQNRELVEALEVLLCAAEMVQSKGYAFAQLDRGVVTAHAALAKAKEAKP